MLDARGNVIGVVSSRFGADAPVAASGAPIEDLNCGVKSGCLLNFLESVPGLSARLKAANAKAYPLEEVVKSAGKASALVLAY